MNSLDGLYKVSKLFLLNLDGDGATPELYAQLSEEEPGETLEELVEDQEEVIEEVVQQEETPSSYVVFDDAEDEELIVTDEPEYLEVQLPEDEDEFLEANDEDHGVSSIINKETRFDTM